MEVLDGTTIFWLFTIGLMAGAITSISIWKKGVKLTTNLIFGTAGSVIVGSIAIALHLPAGLLYGFLGSLSILFILNVFHLQPEESHG